MPGRRQLKVPKHVYLPPDLVDEVERVIERYGGVLRVRNFSQACEEALRYWLLLIRRNEERLRRRAQEMGLVSSA